MEIYAGKKIYVKHLLEKACAGIDTGQRLAR